MPNGSLPKCVDEIFVILLQKWYTGTVALQQADVSCV
jgi:hypothetical protein